MYEVSPTVLKDLDEVNSVQAIAIESDEKNNQPLIPLIPMAVGIVSLGIGCGVFWYRKKI